ncbi:MAG: hypothetical protein Q8L37_02550 [Candidatus Gottesmanbacteria bacterium]|nr:hypothetical protein [Candidatus Gottesmanbacteria bacterium]
MMRASDIFDIYNQLTHLDIEIWLDGGWAVDALLGEETRQHEDVDIVIEQSHVPKLRTLLETKGYRDVPRDDTSPWNFVLGDDAGHLVDVHAVVLDDKGNGQYGPLKNGIMYPVASLTGSGVIAGHPVKCISAEYLVKFHSGYELDDTDRQDIFALCKKFGIDNPFALV